MTHTFWAAGTDGNFNDPTKWTSGVPAGNNAAIDVQGLYSVTLDSAAALNNLMLDWRGATLSETALGSIDGQALKINAGTATLLGANTLDVVLLNGAHAVLKIGNQNAIGGADVRFSQGMLLAETSVTLTNPFETSGHITFGAAAGETLSLATNSFSYNSSLSFDNEIHFGTVDHAGTVVLTGPSPVMAGFPSFPLFVDDGTLRINAFLPVHPVFGPAASVDVAEGARVQFTGSQTLANLAGDGKVVMLNLAAPLLLGGGNFGGTFGDGTQLVVSGPFAVFQFSGRLHDGHIALNNTGLSVGTHSTQGTTVTLDDNIAFAGDGHNPFNFAAIEIGNSVFISTAPGAKATMDDSFVLTSGSRIHFFADSGGEMNFSGGSFDTQGFDYQLNFSGHITGSGAFFSGMLSGSTRIDLTFSEDFLDMRDLGAVSLPELANQGGIDARGTDLTLTGISGFGSLRADDVFLDGTSFSFGGPMQIVAIHVLDADTELMLTGRGHATVDVDPGASVTAAVGGRDSIGIDNNIQVTFDGFSEGTTTIVLNEIDADTTQYNWHQNDATLVLDSSFEVKVKLTFTDAGMTFDNLAFSEDPNGHLQITYATSVAVHDGLLDGVG